MASSFAGGTLRVTTPSSYDAEPASKTRTRDLPSGPEGRAVASKDAIVAALEDAGLDQVERVDLTPRATRDIDGKPSSNRTGNVRLEVDVPPGEDAVVLLERDGVYSWHLPVNPAERTRAIDNEPRTARFEIAVQPRRPTRRRKPTETNGGPAHQGHPRRHRAGRRAGPGVPLRRPGDPREGHREDGGARPPRPPPPGRHRREAVARSWRRSTSSTCRPTSRSGCCCSSTARSPPRSEVSARSASTRRGRGSCAPRSRRTTQSSGSTTRPSAWTPNRTPRTC